MFFALSKTLDLVLDPLWWALLPLVLGIVWLARGQRRKGLAAAVAGLTVLALCASPVVANHLEASLEGRAPNTARADVTYDAIVLLGGMVSPLGSTRDDPAWNDNIERVMVTARVVRAGRAKSVIVSGGSYEVPGLETEAEYLTRQLVEWGVSREQIILEARAKNTRENAVFSKELAQSRGLHSVLVVTSAFHMPRAAGCFRAAEFEVDFLPVDYRMRSPEADTHFWPRSDYLRATGVIVRELFGTLVYRAMGYVR